MRDPAFAACAALVLSGACFSIPGSALAQQAPGVGAEWQTEWRADLLAQRATAVELGTGVSTRAGYYARLTLDAAVGAEWRRGEAAGTTSAPSGTSGTAGTAGTTATRASPNITPSARVDAVSRFLLDPFGELRTGLYGGAGVSLRWSEREGTRGYLLLVAGLEGPVRGRWRSAVELGLGGGARLGVVLRRARSGMR